MNRFKNISEELSNFFIDKASIQNYLQKIDENNSLKKLSQPELEHILNIEQKWKSFPILNRTLTPYLEEITTKRINALSTEKCDSNKKEVSTNVNPPNIRSSDILPTTDSASNSTFNHFTDHSPNQNEYTLNNFHPAPSSIHNFFQSQHIVGEETNQELLIYGTIAGANIGIESLSGSGKSALLYALLEAFPKESYCIIHQTTGKSLYNNPKANHAKYWVIPELQKVFTQDIEEIIKNLTEGISTTYTRTNSARNGIDSFKIDKKNILYSFAITNSHLKQRDEEFHRRFIIINTDISKQQNKRIVQTFAEREFQSDTTHNTTEKENQFFQQHIKNCFAREQENTISYKNPFFPFLIENLPHELTGNIRFRSAVKHLSTLIKGSTAFYNSSYSHPSTKDNLNYSFSTLFENQHTLSLYQSTLIANINCFSVIDQAVLSIMPDTEPLDYHTIQEKVNDNYMINTPLEETIATLTKKNILEKDNNCYRINNPIEINLNWEQALQQADQLMQQKYPQHRDEWSLKTQQQLENIK